MAALGFLALMIVSLACAGTSSGAPAPPVPPPSPPAVAALVSGFGFACDSRRWRVSFVLGTPARVSGGLERREPAGRWSTVRKVLPRTLAAGSHTLELGRHASARTYRIRLSFRDVSGRHASVSRRLRASCTKPPPSTPVTPTLSDHPAPPPSNAGAPQPEGSSEGEAGTGTAGPGTKIQAPGGG